MQGCEINLSLAYNPENAWATFMANGLMYDAYKSNPNHVWPVRAGKHGPPVYLDIKANGSDGPVIVGPSDPVSIDVSLDTGNHMEVNAELNQTLPPQE